MLHRIAKSVTSFAKKTAKEPQKDTTNNVNNVNNDNNDNKKEYAPTVTMKDKEYQKLIDKFGQSDTNDRIERLSLYKQSRGKKYECDYSTILAWARKDGENPVTKNSEVYL